MIFVSADLMKNISMSEWRDEYERVELFIKKEFLFCFQVQQNFSLTFIKLIYFFFSIFSGFFLLDLYQIIKSYLLSCSKTLLQALTIDFCLHQQQRQQQ